MALKNAQAFMSARGISFNASTANVASRAQSRNGQHSSAPAYYVFSNDSKFVIAAGDDTMPAVLGYSDNSSFDANEIPEGLACMLEAYAAAANGEINFVNPASLQGRAAIAPLVKARWNQSAPWNNACPILSSGQHAVTGCVATAMAQVMSYHRWPDEVWDDIPGYVTSTNHFRMPILRADEFPGWSNIKDYYHYNETSGPAADDVAKLMLFVGQSVEMDYDSSSGTQTNLVPNALVNYFGYATTARFRSRTDYTADEWSSILYDELAASRPVVFSGHKKGGSGHAFVCDGYDGNGMFHINWGWYGTSDGFFLLTSMNPSDQGIGAATGSDGYVMSQGMVTGIMPDKGSWYPTDPRLTFSGIILPATSYKRTSTSSDFANVEIQGSVINNSVNMANYDFGFALYDESGTKLIKTVFSTALKGFGAGSKNTSTRSCRITSDVSDGKYRIYPVSRFTNTKEWQKCFGAEVNYVLAEVSGTTLKLTEMGLSGYSKYQYNSLTFNGTRQVNRAMEVVANVTNIGNCPYSEVYLLVNGESATGCYCDIAPGETGDVKVHFTPTEEGEHKISLAVGNSVYNTSVNIGPALEAQMKISSIQVLNANSSARTIGGTSFGVTAKIKNEGNTPYNDIAEARIFRRVSSNSGTTSRKLSQEVSLQPGQEQQIQFSFDNLTIGEDYFVYLYYYSNGEAISNGGTSFYTMVEETVPSGDVNNDGKVDIVDVNMVINMILGFTGKTPSADVNGDSKVDIVDVNLIINKILS
ncbi:MAG: C10 family peptidase [Bacteroidales bacterium]|nr:C10 family peptidase [Candidatus Sodaliphilus aphodohippi]